MRNRRKYGVFRKKHYVRILNWVVNYTLRCFGYTKRPRLIETRLGKGDMMMFEHTFDGEYSILYDYVQFQNIFGRESYDVQEAYAMSMAAHEMRHYYQHRQMSAKNPVENEETIAAWWENECNLKYYGENGCTLFEFYTQPLELDAELYAYVFVERVLNAVISLLFVDENYIDLLEKRYIEIFGETDTDLFGERVKKEIAELAKQKRSTQSA